MKVRNALFVLSLKGMGKPKVAIVLPSAGPEEEGCGGGRDQDYEHTDAQVSVEVGNDKPFPFVRGPMGEDVIQRVRMQVEVADQAVRPLV